MRRSRRRFFLPVVAALVCVAAILVLLWWQLRQAGLDLVAQRQREDTEDRMDTDSLRPIIPQTIVETVIDPGDLSLLHLRKGDLAALQGNWKTAEEEYAQSVLNGGGLPALRKLAQAQLQRDRIEPLQNTVAQMKAAGATADDVLLIDAIVSMRAGNLAHAREILDASNDSPQKHYGWGLLSILEGNHDRAIAELGKAEAGWEPVIRSYAKTLKSAYDEYALFPNSPDIHLVTLIARALAQVQECGLALPLLSQVTVRQQDYRDAWIVRGYCELTSEHPDQALASFEKAYAIDPEKPEIQYFLARAYAGLGDHKNAITFLQYALKNGFQPEQEVRRVLASVALQSGDGTLALEQYVALTGFSDADFEVYQNTVALAVRADRKEEALSKAQAAAQKWPEDARAYDLLGWAAQQLGQTEDAKAAFERALVLDPQLKSAQEHLQGL